MSSTSATDGAGAGRSSWRQAVASYQSPDLRRSLWQIVNTFVPYIVLWILMVRSLAVSYWLTLALAVPAAGFLVRIFIFFHDCGHGSFFKSQRANDILGIITGILTFTPYYAWRRAHAIHHATAGDLDRRGVGDIWTLTVQEYLAAPTWKRLAYRIFRFPPVTFLIGPIVVFLILQRFPTGEKAPRERLSVWATDLALLGVAALMSALIGLPAYLLIQMPVMVIAGAAGVWLFYVQHQFEDTYWERHANWDFATSAMQGASFYRLPKVLQWFSGNIGFHHIHHLSPKIPNYKLPACFAANPIFQQVTPITLRSSLKSLGLHLWDEESRRLVGFGHLKTVAGRA
jgi:omega-6 fatty acid desaturase (delta-12 desaturase)